jgi:hypothetical protein
MATTTATTTTPAAAQAPSKANKAAKPPRWSQEVQAKATNENFFLKAGATVRLKISAAEKNWQKPEFADYVYLVEERFAGKPDEVAAELRQWCKYNDDQVREALARGLTRDNCLGANATKKAEFDREVARANASKEAKEQPAAEGAPAPAKVDMTNLGAILPLMPGAKKVTGRAPKAPRAPRAPKAAAAKGAPKASKAAPAAGSGGAARRQRHVTIFSRLQSLRDNAVLDVSNMQADGSGIRTMDRPKSSKNSNKRELPALTGCPVLPLVSTSQAQHEAAVRRLVETENHPEYAPYLAAVPQCWAQAHAPAAAGVVPTVPVVAPVPAPAPAPAVPAAPVLPPLPAPAPAAASVALPAIPKPAIPGLPAMGLPLAGLPSVAPLKPGASKAVGLMNLPNLPRSPARK